MHNHVVNASIQLIPIVQNGKHPYSWVDEVIELIQKSGLKYDVCPFGTIVEGTYSDVMKLIDSINEYLYREKCDEWVTNVQLQVRYDADVTAGEKVEKFR